MEAKVPLANVQQATLSSVDIGQVAIGQITVGELVLTNTNLSLNSGHGVAKNMNVHVQLSFSLEWWVGVDVWFVHIHIHRTSSLGSVDLNMPPLDVTLNALSNINVAIPNLTGQTVTVQASPLDVKLTNLAADQIAANDVALPTPGFSLSGLSLNSVDGTGVTVPAAGVKQATVGHLHGDTLGIPSLALSNLNLASASAGSIVNTAPLDLPLTLKLSHEPGFDAGILRAILHITANADAHIPYLELNDITASASVGAIALNNVAIPFDVHNLTLADVGITGIAVPTFSVS